MKFEKLIINKQLWPKIRGLILLSCFCLIALYFTKNDTVFSFWVVGHPYGPLSNNRNIYTPLFKKLVKEPKNDTRLKFGVFAGDIVKNASIEKFKIIKEKFNELKVPIYIAPGNHDRAYSKSQAFFKIFGDTFKYWKIKKNLFIILNPNWNNNNLDITTDQILILDKVLKEEYENIFVFVHQILWYKLDYKKLLTPNSKQKEIFNSNFRFAVLPRFQNRKENIYFVGGDVGLNYGKNHTYIIEKGVHFLSTGIGGTKDDAYLKFYIDDQNKVNINLSFLNGRFQIPFNEKTFIYLRKYNSIKRKIKRLLH